MTDPFESLLLNKIKSNSAWRFFGNIGDNKFTPRFFCCTDPNELGLTPGKNPTAVIQLSPNPAQPGETVTFDGTDSYDPDGSVVSYDWDFEGQTPSDSSLSNGTITASNEPGAYTVTLTVTDGTGLKSSPAEVVLVVANEDDFGDSGFFGFAAGSGGVFEAETLSPVSWEDRNEGFAVGSDKINTYDILIDPVSRFWPQGNKVIWRATADGILVSNDSGQTWVEKPLQSVPNQWLDAIAPAVDDLQCHRLLLKNDRLYAGFVWQNATSEYRSFVYYTDDIAAIRSDINSTVTWNLVTTSWDDPTSTEATILLSINHDSGNVASNYPDGVDDPDSRASISVSAALNGSVSGLLINCGSDGSTLQGIGDAGVGNGLEKLGLSAPASNQLKLTLWIDPNSVVASNITLLQVGLQSDGDVSWDGLFLVEAFLFVDAGGSYRIGIGYWDGFANSVNVVVTDAPHKIEVIITKESSTISADGRAELIIDDTSFFEDTTVENNEIFEAVAKLLVFANGTELDTDGSVYADEFVVDNNDESTPTNEFRLLGLDQDDEMLYISGLKDGILKLYKYDNELLAESVTIDEFGNATNAEIDNRTRNIIPRIKPNQSGKLYIYGRTGDDVQISYNSDVNGAGSWVGIGDLFWINTKSVVGFVPSPFTPDELLAIFNDGDIFESFNNGDDWNLLGNSTPTTLVFGNQHTTNDKSLVVCGTGNGEIYLSTNKGQSDKDISISIDRGVLYQSQVANSIDDGQIGFFGYDSMSSVVTINNPIWFRFEDLLMQNSASILSAKLKLIVGTPETVDATIIIDAEDADNPTAPVSTVDFNSRVRTTANQSWVISETWSLNQEIQTIDISNVIQEIVNRPGWTPGNAIQVFLDFDLGVNVGGITTYDGDVSKAAILEIEATESVTGDTIRKVIFDG